MSEKTHDERISDNIAELLGEIIRLKNTVEDLIQKRKICSHTTKQNGDDTSEFSPDTGSDGEIWR